MTMLLLQKLKALLGVAPAKETRPLSRVTIIENIMEPGSWVEFETPDVLTSVQTRLRLQEWPERLRLYRGFWSKDHDVTPYSAADAEEIANTPDHYYAVIEPGEVSGWVLAGAVVLALLAGAAAFAFTSKVPTVASRKSNTQSSSNNALSSRSNQARPGERIPDIFGTVRSYPDLIGGDAWLEFIDNQEVEMFLGCIGNGYFQIHSGRVMDDDTPISQMPNAAAEFYAPGQGVNSDEPFYRVGPAISERYVSVKRNNGFDGPTLRPPDDEVFNGSDNVVFIYPNKVEAPDNFSDRFYPGDVVEISNSAQYNQESYYKRTYLYDRTSLLLDYEGVEQIEKYNTALKLQFASPAVFLIRSADENDNVNTEYFDLAGAYAIAGAEKIDLINGFGTFSYCRIILNAPSSVNPTWSKIPLTTSSMVSSDLTHILYTNILYNFNGEYTIAGVGDGYMFLTDPEEVSPSWTDLETAPEQRSAPMSSELKSTGLRWTPHVVLGMKDRTHVYANFVAPSGAFSDNGENQKRFDVELLVRVMPVDQDDNPLEDQAQDFSATVIGSARTRDMRGTTLKAATSVQGRCAVKFARITTKTAGHKGTVIADVKLRDVYEVSPLRDDVFGNTTKVKVRIPSTSASLAVKERKFNALVTRKLKQYLGNGAFTPEENYPTNNCADILCAAALDPYIGRCKPGELDYENIYGVLGPGGEVETYFGTPLCAEFCYTFDSLDLSDQESLDMIAKVAGCTLYRRGKHIRVFFEKKTDRSSLLFCHRNKVPGSEKRTVTLGKKNQKDGVIFKYISPEDDGEVSLTLPEGSQPVNAEEIESAGVRNAAQARVLACRAWNKQQHGRIEAEFTGLPEANLLLPNYRILNADNTRPNTQDGEVTGQNGLVIHTSQAVTIEGGQEYYAHLQLPDGTVEQIEVLPGPDSRSFQLTRPTRVALETSNEAYVRAMYVLVAGQDMTGARPFLVTDISPQEDTTAVVRATNYDDRFYANDFDFRG